ncbi:MAG TPA: DoxX family protein [Candidatus Didemnitutus sp.]|nr:DoxX family protein [Candidatus Didemnitutus sp.]
MNKLILFSRILLGLMFTVFGLNGFLHFIRLLPHTGVADQFMGALYASKYLLVVCALEAVAGALLLVNRFGVLALAILAPILVNIALFHALMEPQRAWLALTGVALWAVLASRERLAFAALWSPNGVS